ncbi:MAG: MFS transporter [Chloroflexota bacterium]|nr:MFS transporter [Chloroflexota bacterium]
MLAANAVSLSGNVVANVAIPWYVLETTGSAARTGVVGAAALLPMVVAAVFGGGLVDRLDRRRLSIAADLLSGVSVALIPLLALTVGLPFWALLVLVGTGSLFDVPGITARQVLFPDTAERAGIPLERANAWYQAVSRAAQLAGPPLAGLAIALVGAGNALWLNAASFVVSAALFAVGVPATGGDRTATVAASAGSYLAEMREGVTILLRDRLMTLLTWTISVTNLLDAALATVVVPVFVRRVYGEGASTELGLVFGAFGAGSLLGSLLFASVGPRLPRRATYLVAFNGVALLTCAFALFPPLGALLAIRFAAGVLAGPINPLLMTTFQERIPPAARGRVYGLLTAGVLAGSPVGVLVAGTAVDGLGLRPVLFIIGALYVACTAIMAIHPASAGLRRPDLPGVPVLAS